MSGGGSMYAASLGAGDPDATAGAAAAAVVAVAVAAHAAASVAWPRLPWSLPPHRAVWLLSTVSAVVMTAWGVAAWDAALRLQHHMQRVAAGTTGAPPSVQMAVDALLARECGMWLPHTLSAAIMAPMPSTAAAVAYFRVHLLADLLLTAWLQPRYLTLLNVAHHVVYAELAAAAQNTAAQGGGGTAFMVLFFVGEAPNIVRGVGALAPRLRSDAAFGVLWLALRVVAFAATVAYVCVPAEWMLAPVAAAFLLHLGWGVVWLRKYGGAVCRSCCCPCSWRRMVRAARPPWAVSISVDDVAGGGPTALAAAAAAAAASTAAATDDVEEGAHDESSAAAALLSLHAAAHVAASANAPPQLRGTMAVASTDAAAARKTKKN